MNKKEISKLKKEKAKLLADRTELDRRGIVFMSSRRLFHTGYYPQEGEIYRDNLLAYIDNRIYEIEQILNKEQSLGVGS